MPRTVVYGGKSGEGKKGVYQGSPSTPEPDSYSERLVKFVPAEVLAFYILVATQFGSRQGLLIASLVIGTAATPLYLWIRNGALPPEQQARPHYFLLATLAFLAWAIGASPRTGELLGLGEDVSAYVLLAAAFLIPLADQAIQRLQD